MFGYTGLNLKKCSFNEPKFFVPRVSLKIKINSTMYLIKEELIPAVRFLNL